MFDLTDKNTFDHLGNWFSKIEDIAKENIPILLIGNKVDLHENI